MQTVSDHLPLQDRLILLLRAYRTVRFCDDCLALRMGAFPQEVQNALLITGRRYGFQMETAVCSDCLQTRSVVSASTA